MNSASLPLRLLHAVLFLVVAGAAGVICADASPAKLASGAGRFEITHEGMKLPVWYYLPEDARPDSPILIVMHGVNRDPDRYRDEWMPHAKRYGFIVAAPGFSKEAFPDGEDYTFGAKPGGPSSFGFIEPVFDAVKAATGNRSERYRIYGHSAGAQFVHRFLYSVPNARVEQAVAANAGWWTLPDTEVDHPYGLRGSKIDTAALKAMLQRPLVVLLGTADTDPNHVNLRRTPEAMAQGPHRFARGHTFFAAGQKASAAQGVPFGWQLATAAGVAHSDSGMSGFAVQWLFGQPAITGRDPAHVKVLFGGDTGGGESYQEQYAKEGGVNILVEKGYEHGMVHLQRLLGAVDFRVANLETPLTTRREGLPVFKDYVHYSDPVKVPALFTPFRPIAFSLANNHTLDQGVEGLDDTFAALQTAGISWFGAGCNLPTAAKPLIQELRFPDDAITLAVFGAFELRQEYDEQFHFYANAEKGGTAPADVAAVKEAIAKLRQTKPDAFVVYFVHWGSNYVWKNRAQKAMAHDLREAGVDLVVGAHGHMMQEVEHDGRGWIFYGIGNLLFNARGRYDANQAPPFSMPLVVDFSLKDGKPQTAMRVYPIMSDNQKTNYQPRFVTSEEMTRVESLLVEKGAWDAPTRAAVKRGADEIGKYLDFTTPAR